MGFNLRREASSLATDDRQGREMGHNQSFNLRREASSLATEAIMLSNKAETIGFNLRREASSLATIDFFFSHNHSHLFQSQTRSQFPRYPPLTTLSNSRKKMF